MIQYFGDRDTRRRYEGIPVDRSPDVADAARYCLTVLDCTDALRDLASLRSVRLESLDRDDPARFCITIDDRCAVSFRWTPEGPGDVAIDEIDVHRDPHT